MKQLLSMILAFMIAILSGTQLYELQEGYLREFGYPYTEHTRAEQLVYNYAWNHDLRYSDYPRELVELLDRNPETSKFVLEYPLKKDLRPEIDLSEYADSPTVPLFMQWDQR